MVIFYFYFFIYFFVKTVYANLFPEINVIKYIQNFQLFIIVFFFLNTYLLLTIYCLFPR